MGLLSFSLVYQLAAAYLSKRVWRVKEPRSFGEVGEMEGMIPSGKPLPKSESCCGRRVRHVGDVNIGTGSPGTDRAEPSRVWGLDTFRSQNAASMASRRFGIFLFPLQTSLSRWSRPVLFSLSFFYVQMVRLGLSMDSSPARIRPSLSPIIKYLDCPMGWAQAQI